MVSLAGSLAGYTWALALSLSLTAAALISYLILRLSPRRAFEVSLGAVQRRAFKGGALSYHLSFDSPEDEERALVELVQAPEGVQARLEPRGERGHVLVVSSNYAGVFSGFSLKVGIGDPLGLYNRFEGRRLELAAEFLPSSLLARQEGIAVSAAMLGDRPAGSRGFGL